MFKTSVHILLVQTCQKSIQEVYIYMFKTCIHQDIKYNVYGICNLIECNKIFTQSLPKYSEISKSELGIELSKFPSIIETTLLLQGEYPM